MLRKTLKLVVLATISIMMLSWLFIYVISAGTREKTVYRENDFLSYLSLTDNEIKKAPRISHNYYFESLPGDGYAPSNSIIFNDVTEIEALHVYLRERGYIREKRSSGMKEIWSKASASSNSLFYLYFDTTTERAELTKVLNN